MGTATKKKEWLTGLFSSTGQPKARPLKFQIGLTIHELNEYPQSGTLFVKWKDGQGNVAETARVMVNAAEHVCRWEASFELTSKILVDNETNVLLPRTLHMSIREVERRTGTIKRVGVVDANVSEFVASGKHTRVYILKECKVNCSIRITITARQLTGDPLFRCPLSAAEQPEQLTEAQPRPRPKSLTQHSHFSSPQQPPESGIERSYSFQSYSGSSSSSANSSRRNSLRQLSPTGESTTISPSAYHSHNGTVHHVHSRSSLSTVDGLWSAVALLPAAGGGGVGQTGGERGIVVCCAGSPSAGTTAMQPVPPPRQSHAQSLSLASLMDLQRLVASDGRAPESPLDLEATNTLTGGAGAMHLRSPRSQPVSPEESLEAAVARALAIVTSTAAATALTVGADPGGTRSRRGSADLTAVTSSNTWADASGSGVSGSGAGKRGSWRLTGGVGTPTFGTEKDVGAVAGEGGGVGDLHVRGMNGGGIGGGGGGGEAGEGGSGKRKSWRSSNITQENGVEGGSGGGDGGGAGSGNGGGGGGGGGSADDASGAWVGGGAAGGGVIGGAGSDAGGSTDVKRGSMRAS